MTLKAPFPYFGGKSRVAHEVWHRLGDVTNFIEPFCGSAAVLLHPIAFPEPFGLSVVEAIACGTPVITYPRGSMPEARARASDAVRASTDSDQPRSSSRK